MICKTIGHDLQEKGSAEFQALCAVASCQTAWRRTAGKKCRMGVTCDGGVNLATEMGAYVEVVCLLPCLLGRGCARTSRDARVLVMEVKEAM
jgi:hypothetical protein